jgi:hypothetical protein
MDAGIWAAAAAGTITAGAEAMATVMAITTRTFIGTVAFAVQLPGRQRGLQ